MDCKLFGDVDAAQVWLLDEESAEAVKPVVDLAGKGEPGTKHALRVDPAFFVTRLQDAGAVGHEVLEMKIGDFSRFAPRRCGAASGCGRRA